LSRYQFKLPVKEKLFVEFRKGRTKREIGGEFKDNVYEALSKKNLIRQGTPFSTEKADYGVLSYERHGESANVSIHRLSKQKKRGEA